MTKTMLELFSGSGVMAKAFKERGWRTLTLDHDPTLGADLVMDIEDASVMEKVMDAIGRPDVIWASPPCTCFSVASIGKHWTPEKTPKTAAAKEAIRIIDAMWSIIDTLKPKIWFIENPRGMLRTLPAMRRREATAAARRTISYCRYSERRMKPTDIWTNTAWAGRGSCSNGDTCHVAAPRGSRTPGSTQGIDGAYGRGKLPAELCEEIADHCDKEIGR